MHKYLKIYILIEKARRVALLEWLYSRFCVMAGCVMPVFYHSEIGNFASATVGCERAACMETAAAWRIDRGWYVSF